MDRQRHDLGVKIRKEVLGAEYVEKSMANVDEFSAPFQEILNEYCWGGSWGRGVLSKQQRSILNLGMLAALGRSHEFGLHFRGALNNGLSRDELREVLIQIAVYCGIPAGVESFRIARGVLAEIDAEKKQGGDD
jgi:4-carboxymuconolactone decarboxylase